MTAAAERAEVRGGPVTSSRECPLLSGADPFRPLPPPTYGPPVCVWPEPPSASLTLIPQTTSGTAFFPFPGMPSETVCFQFPPPIYTSGNNLNISSGASLPSASQLLPVLGLPPLVRLEGASCLQASVSQLGVFQPLPLPPLGSGFHYISTAVAPPLPLPPLPLPPPPPTPATKRPPSPSRDPEPPTKKLPIRPLPRRPPSVPKESTSSLPPACGVTPPQKPNRPEAEGGAEVPTGGVAAAAAETMWADQPRSLSSLLEDSRGAPRRPLDSNDSGQRRNLSPPRSPQSPTAINKPAEARAATQMAPRPQSPRPAPRSNAPSNPPAVFSSPSVNTTEKEAGSGVIEAADLPIKDMSFPEPDPTDQEEEEGLIEIVEVDQDQAQTQSQDQGQLRKSAAAYSEPRPQTVSERPQSTTSSSESGRTIVEALNDDPPTIRICFGDEDESDFDYLIYETESDEEEDEDERDEEEEEEKPSPTQTSPDGSAEETAPDFSGIMTLCTVASTRESLVVTPEGGDAPKSSESEADHQTPEDQSSDSGTEIPEPKSE
ncbi:hypothetical protein MRV_0128 [Murine roseolovirus]|nr:hypothetical protein MRV_0128 [Murine roseolovirus]APZ76339.1 hypothetical protein MRV_0128 [Murid betaherpesvirus 3]